MTTSALSESLTTSAVPAHDGVELFQEPERARAAVGEVEGQRHAGTGKGEQAGRGDVAEILQHGEKRAFARGRDPREQRAHGLAAPLVRDHALVLHETASTVQPVPAVPIESRG